MEVDQDNARSGFETGTEANDDELMKGVTPDTSIAAVTSDLSPDQEALRAASAIEVPELEVRWMTGGDLVCMVQASLHTCAMEVKEQVQSLAGIPIVEQRLFAADAELSANHTVSKCSTARQGLLLVREGSDPRHSDVSYFRRFAVRKQVPAGSFTTVKRLADAIHGKIYLCRWHRPEQEDERVVVKKMQNGEVDRHAHTEISEWNMHLRPGCSSVAEDALNEIGVFNYLSQQTDLPVFLLRAHGAFIDKRDTWLVTEYADGGELFYRAASGDECSEEELRRCVWQLLQAVRYLHGHFIGHRDISLENILLKDGVVRLMDFGMAARTYSASGEPVRYFRAVGKDMYRAPECYVPSGPAVKVLVPHACNVGNIVMASTLSGSLCMVRLPPGAVSGQFCTAEVWGYAIPSADIFSCAVAFFILNWQCPLWHCARLGDKAFAFVHSRGDGGIEALLGAWKKPLLPPDAMKLLSTMLDPDPGGRYAIDECLASPWFAPLVGTPVPVHP